MGRLHPTTLKMSGFYAPQINKHSREVLRELSAKYNYTILEIKKAISHYNKI